MAPAPRLEAVWSRTVPSWDQARAEPRPWWSAAVVHLRPARWRVARRLAAHPWTAAVVGVRCGPRGALAYLAWLDSAWAFGVGTVVDPGGRRLPLPQAPRRRRRGAEAGRLPISLHVITQDEEGRIGAAIASASSTWSEAVVVDGGSVDATVAEAEAAGARVVHRPFDRDFGAQRNFGLAEVRSPWVLHLDSDEELTEAGRTVAALAQDGPWDVVFVPRATVILEAPEQPFSWPNMRPRLFRSHLRFAGRVHEEIVGWRLGLYCPLYPPVIRHDKPWERFQERQRLFASIELNDFTRSMLEQRLPGAVTGRADEEEHG